METYQVIAIIALLIGVALSIGKYQHQNQK